eukprot:7780206-Pyramimonas_sp.AAC.1
MIDGDRLPPPPIERSRVPPSIPKFPTLSSPGTERQRVLPTDARIKQKERISESRQRSRHHTMQDTRHHR